MAQIKPGCPPNFGTSSVNFRGGGGGGGGSTNGEWRRFEMVGASSEGGTSTAATIYSSLTESVASTVWEMPDYTANPFTTPAGTGAAIGRTFVRPLTDAGGAAVQYGNPFQLYTMLELINVSISTGNASDWGGSGEVEPVMCMGVTAQTDANLVPTNNFLAGAWSSENNNQPLNSKTGWNKGPISGSTRTAYINNAITPTNTFPTFYYHVFNFGPDFTNNNLNSQVRVRAWQDVAGVQTGIGPNGWSSGNIPANTDQTSNADVPLNLFVSISPRNTGGTLINQRNNAQLTVTFRWWYMVNYIAAGWAP